MSKKNTKRALVLSCLSLLLCLSMLVGSTFAWFTDTASTSVNKIQAGTLDIGLVDKDGNSLEGQSLSFADVNGNTDILWEPGATFLTQGFKIVDKGNLAFKYKIIITGLEGDSKLLEVIRFSVVKEDEVPAAMAGNSYTDLVGKWQITFDPETGKNVATMVTAPETELMYLMAHMDKAAGNEYQGLSLEGIGITVLATQDTVENDSFDNQYDKDAEWPVYTAEDLQKALESGVAPILLNDVTVEETLNIAQDTAIYLNGNTLTVAMTDSDAIAVSGGAELTISGGDLVISVEDPSYGTTYHAISVTNNTADTTTTVNLQNVDVTLPESDKDWNDGTIYVSAAAGEAVLNIGEGAVITSDKHIVFTVGENGTVNMNDGEITASNYAAPTGWTVSYGAILEGNATFNMTNGLIHLVGDVRADAFSIMSDDATLNITGGSVVVDSPYSSVVTKYGCNPTINIDESLITVNGTGSVIVR